MLSLIETLRRKKSYEILKPSIDEYYNITSRIYPVVDDAILSTSRFDLSGIGQVYDSHYESLNTDYEQCKDSVERILLVLTRTGVFEASDIDISTPLRALFDYIRNIMSIDFDWDILNDSISAINIEMAGKYSLVDSAIQESHILLYHSRFVLDEMGNLVDFFSDNNIDAWGSQPIPSVIDSHLVNDPNHESPQDREPPHSVEPTPLQIPGIWVKYKRILEFLISSKDANLSDLPRLQKEFSLL